MSVATDPKLVADLQAGNITSADYAKIMADRNRADDLAAKEAALRAAANVSPTLIASELALARSSAARAQAEADRRRAQEKAAAKARARQKAEQDRLLKAKREAQVKANELARVAKMEEAAALMRTQAENERILAKKQAAERAAMDAQAKAEADRVSQAEAAVSAIAEAARQEMLQSTGRVHNAEQEGQILAEAINYVDAYQAYAAGERESPLPDSVIGYVDSPAAPPISTQPNWPGGDQVGESQSVAHLAASNESLLSDPGAYTPTGTDLVGGGSSGPLLPDREVADELPETPLDPTPDIFGIPQNVSLAEMFSPGRLLIAALIFATTGILIGVGQG